MDIRACENEDVNKEYATDKARFCYDGLNKKRITEPMIRDPSGNLVPYGWDEVLQSKILNSVQQLCLKYFDFVMIIILLVCGDGLIDAGERVAALAGPFTDAETLTVTRDLLNILGSEHYYTEEYCDVNTDFRSHYLMNLPFRYYQTPKKRMRF